MLDLTSNGTAFEDVLGNTSSAGSTYIAGALGLAKQQLDAQARPFAHQVVVVLLDGQPDEWRLKANGEAKYPEYKADLDSALKDLKRQVSLPPNGLLH